METLVKRNGNFPLMNTFVDDFLSKDIFDWTERNFAALGSNLPSANLKETERKLEVELAAPGMNKEDFNIEIDNNILKISCENETEHEETGNKNNYVRKEFSYHKFSRTFYLPDSADDENVEAAYDNGILTVSIPKKENNKGKTAKTILIK